MRIRIENLVSITDANQNFSRVARLVDDTGVAVILKNNVPRYVLLAYDQLEAPQADAAMDEDVLAAAQRVVQGFRGEPEQHLLEKGAPMLYCEACQQVFPAETAADDCDECGNALRRAKPNDPVLLVTTGFFKATLIEPLLVDMKIPYAKQSENGVAFTMRAGGLNETYRFYVPYGAYHKSRALLEETFGEDAEIMDALR